MQKSYIYIYILTSLFGAIALSSNPVYADDVIDTVTVTVPISCTLSSAVDTAHTASIPNSTYRSDIGTTTFTVFCNDNNGYSVYAAGYSNNEHGNTVMLSSDGDVSSNIATGIATSGNASNWAMKLNPVASTYAPTIENGFDSYHVVPTTYTKVATFPSITDTDTGSSFQSTYQVYISGTQKAGTYTGKVRYTIVHPASEVPVEPVACDANKICYNPNASGVADTMADQDSTMVDEYAYEEACETAGGYVDWSNYPTLGCKDEDDDSDISITTPYTTAVELWASNFQRSGYGFAGWQDEDGNIYGPNQTVDTSAMDLSTSGLALYARWVASAGDMQSWTGCTALGIGSVTALTDTRDNNVYAVAKLADGNCWMIENMRLGSSATLTASNTNNPTISNLSASVDPTVTAWCTDWNSTCVDQSMLNTSNTTSPVANMTSQYDTNVYSYGNYYNWYSATAGTRSYNDDYGQATGSICPLGWRLPAAADDLANVDFYKLALAVSGQSLYGSSYYSGSTAETVRAALRTYPNNFINSGYVWGFVFYYRGAVGSYWSASAYGSDGAYELYFGPGYVYPGTGDWFKYTGYTVRCMFGSSLPAFDGYIGIPGGGGVG